MCSLHVKESATLRRWLDNETKQGGTVGVCVFLCVWQEKGEIVQQTGLVQERKQVIHEWWDDKVKEKQGNGREGRKVKK